MTIRIANGAGFLGDNLDAPRLLVQSATIEYLTLEYLAELTMSILARARQKRTDAGYARDFIEVLSSLVPELQRQEQLRIVTNAGGVNPLACASVAAEILDEEDLSSVQIGVVSGDDLLDRLAELQAAGCRFENLDTGQPLQELTEPIVCANAYLGAPPIVEALNDSARIVITGRVADVSLTVGPALHRFGWKWNDWNRLAGASVAGHLIECGAQVTGGYSTDWRGRDLANIGYPIAELSDEGSCVITKPQDSGGLVNRQTVTEQLVYEIGDPRHYLTPDVDVDFTSVALDDAGSNRVSVRGATGREPPDSYKVSLAYECGYTATGQLLVYGWDCIEKADACAEIIANRLNRAGIALDNLHVELLGTGNSVPGVAAHQTDQREVLLRITAQSRQRQAIERFTKEFAPLITSGPAGLAGYAAGRPTVRPTFAYWPTLVPKDLIEPKVEVRTARRWRER